MEVQNRYNIGDHVFWCVLDYGKENVKVREGDITSFVVEVNKDGEPQVFYDMGDKLCHIPEQAIRPTLRDLAVYFCKLTFGIDFDNENTETTEEEQGTVQKDCTETEEEQEGENEQTDEQLA